MIPSPFRMKFQRLFLEHFGTARASVALYLAQSIGFIAGLAANVVISRTLGPRGQGEFFLIITSASLAATLGNLGIEGVLTLQGAKSDDALAPQINGLLAGFTLMQAVLFLTIGCASALLAGSRIGIAILAAGVLAPLLAFQNGFSALASARHDLHFLNLFSMVGPFLNFVAAGLLALRGTRTPIGFVGGVLAANAICVAGMTTVLWVFRKGFAAPSALRSQIASLARVALGCYASNLAVMFRERLNVYLLAAFGGRTAVGLFSIAWTLAQKMVAGADAVATVMTHRLVKEPATDVMRTVRRTLAAFSIPLIPAFLGAVYFGARLIPIIWGPDYARAAPAFQILAFVFVFYLPSRLLAVVLSFNRIRPDLTAALGWAGILVTLPLAVWLNAAYGLYGAALAVVARSAVDLLSLVSTLHYLHTEPQHTDEPGPIPRG